jgi:hypothetical protein
LHSPSNNTSGGADCGEAVTAHAILTRAISSTTCRPHVSWRWCSPPRSCPPRLLCDRSRGLPGARILGGGGKLPDSVYARFFELAGGDKARIVLIPTAGARPTNRPNATRR